MLIAQVRRIEVDGQMLTRREWKEFMEECSHAGHFSYPDVTLMDGSQMAICERCKYVQYAAIAKMIDGKEFE